MGGIMKKSLLSTSIFLAGFAASSIAFADVPVYNAYKFVNDNQNNNQQQSQQAQSNNQVQLPQPLNQQQRIAKLEQQVNNLNQMNLSQQITAMQQQIQDLRGQLEVQAHEIKRLRQAQTTMYQGLDNRVAKISAKNSGAASATKQTIRTNPASSNLQPVSKNPAHAQITPAQANSYLSQQDAYEAGYNLITKKQYGKAITALTNYLQKYPQGDYAANAHYWLGELYFIQNNSQKAIGELQTVVNNYPNSPKAADAQLKLGFVYYDSGQLGKAKVILEKVVNQHPNTTVARLAQSRLNELQRLQQANKQDANQPQSGQQATQ